MTWLALIALGTAVAVVVACAMEPWARMLHGQVWHRSLWGVHRSHHSRRRGRFELNDVLSATHAPIAAALIMIGCNLHGPAAAIAIGVGAGMSVFGIAYVVVHDGLVHGRLPVAFLGRLPFLRGVKEAHSIHHARGEAPYGFFLGPAELKRTTRARGARPSARRTAAREQETPRDRPPGDARPSS